MYLFSLLLYVLHCMYCVLCVVCSVYIAYSMLCAVLCTLCVLCTVYVVYYVCIVYSVSCTVCDVYSVCIVYCVYCSMWDAEQVPSCRTSNNTLTLCPRPTSLAVSFLLVWSVWCVWSIISFIVQLNRGSADASPLPTLPSVPSPSLPAVVHIQSQSDEELGHIHISRPQSDRCYWAGRSWLTMASGVLRMMGNVSVSTLTRTKNILMETKKMIYSKPPRNKIGAMVSLK